MTLRCFVNCPAYRLTDEAHSGRAQAAAQALAGELGWQCTFAASLSDHHGIGCWPSREQRLSEALQALEHEFWWPARGGYGCTELAAELLPSLPARTTLIGYSDITALHAAWIISDSCESIYAMMPGVSAGQRAHQSLTACLSGSALSLSSATTPGTSLRRGTASGPIFAACLRVLASLVGGPLMPELRGRILAIEDIDLERRGVGGLRDENVDDGTRRWILAEVLARPEASFTGHAHRPAWREHVQSAIRHFLPHLLQR